MATPFVVSAITLLDQFVRADLGDLAGFSVFDFHEAISCFLAHNNLCGHAQHIRELFSQYLEELEQSIATFNGLPEELRKANFDSMISLLKEGLKTSDYKSAMANIEDFYWCLSGVDKYSLFKQQIVLNQGTFKSNQLVTTSKNCGISKIWEQISSSDEIEQYTGKSGIEERATVVISEWNAFFKERDLIVHQLSKASGWRKDKILNSIKFHKMIVTQLTRVLDKSLSSYL